ncbi:MAG: hypothetical protein OEY33_04900 [Bdellovibrionales bacterium]|jgi:hypothetical protein|nr:hypothetical protein [Bdellovibrionales bacterium]
MLPGEMQAILAKILFFVFATFMICLARVKAHDIYPAPMTPKAPIESTKSM